ncbi:MAG: PAC2 family protein, partial [Pirellula sp.]|nr:PAC2 family protein [Pirellula sp.]
VFGAAIDEASLDELKRLKVEMLEDGHIGGLNGILLGAAAELGLRGACLLGEMPHILAQIPFPKASLAVLKVFTMVTDIDIDTKELSEQAQAMDEKLGEILADVESMMEPPSSSGQENEAEYENPEEQSIGESEEKPEASNDRLLIEGLFEQAHNDRSKAYELKQELDRLGWFQEYEDRFLDLFTNPE